MASNIKAIKNRIASIESTKKVTSAMQLVSMAKLQKYQKKSSHVKKYKAIVKTHMEQILARAVENKESIFDSPFFRRNKEIKHVGYIIFTSDVGLCGGYNINVLKKAQELVKKDIEAGREPYVYMIGKVGVEKAKYFDVPVFWLSRGVNDTFGFSDVADIVDGFIDQYKSGDLDQINVIYTNFENTLVQNVQTETLLPIPHVEQPKMDIPKDTIFEPNAETLLDVLVPKYMESLVYIFFLESHTSEEASRRIAMENSNKNAQQFLVDLKQEYNQVRQALITQEMAEIIGGAENLN